MIFFFQARGLKKPGKGKAILENSEKTKKGVLAMTNTMAVGLKLSLPAVRRIKGYTQKEAAAKIGVSRNTLRRWENYQTNPTLENAYMICSLYDVPFEFIQWSRQPEGITVTAGQIIACAAMFGKSVDEFLAEIGLIDAVN